MEPRSKQQPATTKQSNHLVCECCQGLEHRGRRMPRREFLTTSAGVVLGASAIGSVLPAGRVWAQAKAASETAAAATSSPESLVKVLFETLPVAVTKSGVVLAGTGARGGRRTLAADSILVLIGGVPSWDLLTRIGMKRPQQIAEPAIG